MKKETQSRRSFLNKLWLLLGSVALAEWIAMIFTFFKPRKQVISTAQENAIITVGSVDKFEPGTVSAFIRGKFYLARLDDGGFLAMSRRCTHLSCTVPWVSGENKFICPCHSSEFDIRGEVANPPAPRALDLYHIDIQNKVLTVDTAKLTKRATFAADQVTYPEKT
jgi:cytochrome b6-f complex iron-sulfur subunit